MKDPSAVQRDIDTLRAALTGRETEAFIPSVSPGQIARFMSNEYYPSHEAYVYALAEAMRPEYAAIADAAFILQVDCPDLASGRANSEFASLALEDWLAIAISFEVANPRHAHEWALFQQWRHG